MDVNITSPIAANITLIQSLWVPALNLTAGFIGALIGAVAIYFVARYEKGQEIQKTRREERKNAYLKLLTALNILRFHYLRAGSTGIDVPDRDIELATSALWEFKALASVELNSILFMSNLDFNKDEEINSFLNKALPIIAKEVQGEDVYAIIDQTLQANAGQLSLRPNKEEEKTRHWWQFLRR
jgi:hypothetical protein